jgi:predicted HicB family RNase H-like nuclease
MELNENQKKRFKAYLTPKNIAIGILGLLLIISLIGGGYGYRALIKKQKAELKLKDDEILQSQKKQDSISKVVDFYKDDADYYREQSENLNAKNKILNDEIKRKQKLLSVRDTSFRNNARIITNSVNRYYSGKDSIR